MNITDFLRTDICEWSTLNKGKTWNCKTCGKMNIKNKVCLATSIIEKEKKKIGNK